MPNKPVRHLSLDEVLSIHEASLKRFGGAPPGVRDLGLLERALFRPQTGYYRDLAEMAAALFESLIMNRPSIDGNKRVAFFAMDIFLRLSGWEQCVEAKAAHALLIGLLERSLRERSKPTRLKTYGRGGFQPSVDLDDSAALLHLMESDGGAAGR